MSNLSNNTTLLQRILEIASNLPEAISKLSQLENDAGFVTDDHSHDAGDITSGTLPVANGGTGVTSLSALASAMGACSFETGTYTGTGTYGKNNPINITFTNEPKIVMIFGNSNTSFGIFYIPQIKNGETATDAGYVWGGTSHGVLSSDPNDNFLSKFSGKTLYWYSQETVEKQLNSSNKVYYYVAIR